MTETAPLRVAALMPCHARPPARELLARVQALVHSVLVVDDGMPQARAAELDRLATELGVGVAHMPHRGKGHAVAAGLEVLAATARAAGVLLIDADGQHPPDAIPRFIEAAQTADLVVGDRFGDHAAIPLLRRVANRSASKLVSRSTGSAVPDSQCGMRLLTRRALHEIRFQGGGFEAETLHLRQCLLAGVSVDWVAIPAIYEKSPSAFRPIRDSIAVLRACTGRRRSGSYRRASLRPRGSRQAGSVRS